MTAEQFHTLIGWLMTFMQFSILVPMVVVWRRRRHFSPPVQVLSWYVYISAFFALGARLSAIYLHNNLFFIIGFNVAKVLLFVAVYRLVLIGQRTRRVLAITTLVALGTVAASLALSLGHAMAVSRVVQCTLLAGFALMYLEQKLNQFSEQRFSNDPIWLLGVGQLIYSAATVSGFSLEILFPFNETIITYFSMLSTSLASLVFNCFITVAFLRATPGALVPVAVPDSKSQLVIS